MARYYFQFQTGAIKRLYPILAQKPDDAFNSKLVRLKELMHVMNL